MITLTGRVSDFKTGQNLDGINIIHREPWVATTTNRQGEFTIDLPAGYNILEISGMNIKVTHRQFMLYGEGIVHIELEEEDHMLDEPYRLYFQDAGRFPCDSPYSGLPDCRYGK